MSAANDEGGAGDLALVAALRGGQAWLEVNRYDCARCARGRGCGAALLGSDKLRLVRIEARQRWQVGQRVPLPPLRGSLLRLAWLAHGAPLVALLGGLVAGHGLARAAGLGATAADLFALAAGTLGLWLVRRPMGRAARFITPR